MSSGRSLPEQGQSLGIVTLLIGLDARIQEQFEGHTVPPAFLMERGSRIGLGPCRSLEHKRTGSTQGQDQGFLQTVHGRASFFL